MACFLGSGSLYGGGCGVLPAFLSDMFGAKISSATHGAAIFFWSLACVVGAPLFAAVNSHYAVAAGGVTVPSTTGYAVNALWLAAFPASALLAGFLLNVRREDRRAARATNTWRGRLGAHLCVCNTGGRGWQAFLLTFPFCFSSFCRVLSPAQQQAEYESLGVGQEEGAGDPPAAAEALSSTSSAPFATGSRVWGEDKDTQPVLPGSEPRMEWSTRLGAWEENNN